MLAARQVLGVRKMTAKLYLAACARAVTEGWRPRLTTAWQSRRMPLISAPAHAGLRRYESFAWGICVARDYDPVQGQWYEDLEENEIFKVLSVDPDQEIIGIQYENGDIEEIDLDTWHELDLEHAQEPEGWAADEDEDEEEEEEDDEDEEDWDEDEDDDWDDDEDEDLDDDDDYNDRGDA